MKTLVSIACAALLAGATALAAPGLAAAQSAPTAAAASAPAQQAADDPDLDPKLSEPDFNVVTLPTTLRLPRFKSAFRVTHRFGRPLGQGDFGSLAEDLFGLDSGALIGLEYRFAPMRGLQAGIYRTSDRTIEFFSRYNLLQQGEGMPVSLDASASIDGTNNFRDSYTPVLGVVVSRQLGEWGALYVEPLWANNSNPVPSELTDDNDTLMLGLGARIRVRPTVYVVGEVIPRTGFEPGTNHATFGVEKRAGGHVFQLNFSNGVGTTMGQIARGGTAWDDWYLGFSISRKFY
jgi:hypothetical protein